MGMHPGRKQIVTGLRPEELGIRSERPLMIVYKVHKQRQIQDGPPNIKKVELFIASTSTYLNHT
jgi:hypothetical protein